MKVFFLPFFSQAAEKGRVDGKAAAAATATWELWSQGDEIMKGDFGAARILSLCLSPTPSRTLSHTFSLYAHLHAHTHTHALTHTHTLSVLSLGRA